VTEPRGHARIRLLVVHTHHQVREGLAACLGYEADMDVVGTAPTCGIALDLAAELHPDLVLIGRSTPWTGGLAATRHLVDAQPEIRVVILSGTYGHESATEAVRCGALGYVPLDTPPSEIASTVRRLVRG
jgi:two-component system, NarL family, response regulator LiaR